MKSFSEMEMILIRQRKDKKKGAWQCYVMLCHTTGVKNMILRTGAEWDMDEMKAYLTTFIVLVYCCLPFAALETSSWTLALSVFFFFTTVVPFLSNVIGLYCGRLLNFLSNSSSSFPRLTSRVQSSHNGACINSLTMKTQQYLGPAGRQRTKRLLLRTRTAENSFRMCGA